MAKKKSSLKLGKRAAKLLKQDFIHSVAIVSVVLNLLFLVGWAVITNGSADQDFYDHARARLCDDNYDENLKKTISEAETEAMAKVAAIEFKVQCVSSDFSPYYENAIESYTQTLNVE